VGYGVPYNHLLFTDSLEPLVDVALQILIVTLDHDTTGGVPLEEGAIGDNLFINYLSRIHRDEGNIFFQFIYFEYFKIFILIFIDCFILYHPYVHISVIIMYQVIYIMQKHNITS